MSTSPVWPRERAGLLQQRLVNLAGTPDDSGLISADLVLIARLAADRLAAVDYASVTSRYEGAYATVAVSDDLVLAVDEAQYREGGGPCLETLESGQPHPVADIGAVVTWPGFRDAAARLGLRASLSLPLFAGSGRSVAALNLYGRRAGPMKVLTEAVQAAYHPGASESGHHDDLDAGGRELVAGLIGSLALRDLIQQAIGILIATTGRAEECAYLTLRMQAAESGLSLTDAAVRVIEHQQS